MDPLSKTMGTVYERVVVVVVVVVVAVVDRCVGKRCCCERNMREERPKRERRNMVNRRCYKREYDSWYGNDTGLLASSCSLKNNGVVVGVSARHEMVPSRITTRKIVDPKRSTTRLFRKLERDHSPTRRRRVPRVTPDKASKEKAS